MKNLLTMNCSQKSNDSAVKKLYREMILPNADELIVGDFEEGIQKLRQNSFYALMIDNIQFSANFKVTPEQNCLP